MCGDCCSPSETRSKSKTYDLAVIGAGSAGFSAAITAAGEGASVALIGHGTIGGTCVNVGCVPSKTMIRAAEALHNAGAASRFPGLAGEAHVSNWRELIAAKDDLVTGLRKRKYIDLLPDYESVDYVEGVAHFTGSTVMVGGAGLKAGKFIIATGSSPKVPDIRGLDGVPFLTSTTALELSEQPRSLLIVGGGYIGCELAQMFARSGTSVTMVTRTHLMPGAEPEISAALTGYLEDEGIKVVTGVSYTAIKRSSEGVALTVNANGKPVVLAAEKVLTAAGRRPNTDGLGLAESGVRLSDGGAVEVDNRMRTSKAGVYAAGDVTGHDQYVYMAAYGAKIAAKNALNGNSLIYDNAIVPWVVFTDPQIAGVGLTEATAQTRGIKTKTSLVNLDQVPRAIAARDTRGLMKLVAEAKTGQLLGGQILAPEGADSIQTLALAIRARMTAVELGETIFPYLTTVEGLKLAAQGFQKDVAKLSCCAG